MEVPLWAWLTVLAVIVAMLMVDLFLHRDAHVIRIREAAVWSAIWVALGLTFGVIVWLTMGSESGQAYYAGYLIEKSLSVDNVFVWAVILTFFAVPREYQHRVLFLGVLGALVFRGIFIAAGSALVEEFSWVLYVFAAILLVTGIRLLRASDDHIDPGKSRILRWFGRVMPMIQEYRGQRFVVRHKGVLVATPLLAVLVLVEFTDILFAVDSIPAIFAITTDPFIVFTANAFALLGLRAMYFLLADLMHRFVYLNLGLAVILIWVSIKMFLKVDLLYVPTWISLLVITVVLTVAVVASLRRTSGEGRKPVEVEAPPFRVRDEDGGVLPGHEAEYGDDSEPVVIGGTRRARARLAAASAEGGGEPART